MATEPELLKIRDEKVTVLVRVVFLKIGEIETVKECFSAEAFIQAKWREPALDGFIDSPKKIKEIKGNDYWNPDLSIVNALGDPRESIWYTVVFNDQKEAFMCERRKMKGTFLENLELDEFPFDTQDISLTIMSERPEREVTLEMDRCELSSINVHSFVDEQEWNLYKHVLTSEKTVDRTYEGSCDHHTTLSFTCRASRRFGFFVWNIFFVMFIICSMAFTTFALDFTSMPTRIQMTMFILLTTMTFKFSVSQSLPKLSYLTYLDFYILSAMVTICLIISWFTLFGGAIFSSMNPVDAYWVDKWVHIAFLVVYFGGHLVLVLFVFSVVRRRRRQDTEDETEYLERARMIVDKTQLCLLELGK